jgi:hypothetical protein
MLFLSFVATFVFIIIAINKQIYMERNINIPARQNRNKYLTLKITPSEQTLINNFCEEKGIRRSDLLRYFLNQIIPNIQS